MAPIHVSPFDFHTVPHAPVRAPVRVCSNLSLLAVGLSAPRLYS